LFTKLSNINLTKFILLKYLDAKNAYMFHFGIFLNFSQKFFTIKNELLEKNFRIIKQESTK